MNTDKLGETYQTLIDHMQSVGYSESRTEWMLRSVRYVLDNGSRWSCYDDALEECRERERRGELDRDLRGAIWILKQFEESGALPRTEGFPKQPQPSAYRALPPSFQEVVDAYVDVAAGRGIKPRTVATRAGSLSCFLGRLEALGRPSPESVTEEDVLQVLTDADGNPVFDGGTVGAVREALRDASAAAPCAGRILLFVPASKRWRKIVPSMTEDERRKLRMTLCDPASPLSTRDRAVGCLLYFTGMRAGDVAALRLADIDWEGDMISFAQQKTGVQVELPLTAVVGNAIYDYVTTDRGPSEEPYVFLSLSHPYGKLSSQSIRSSIAGKVYDAAGIRQEPGDRRGSHLLRYNAATAMLEAGSPRPVVRSILGQTSPEVIDRYAAADVERMRALALDVSSFPVAEGVL